MASDTTTREGVSHQRFQDESQGHTDSTVNSANHVKGREEQSSPALLEVEGGMPLPSFEASVALIPKLDRDIGREDKAHYRLES